MRQRGGPIMEKTAELAAHCMIRIESGHGNGFSVQCPSHYWQHEREEKEEEALLSRLTQRRKRERERERERESLMVAGRPINQFWLRETIKRMIHLEKRGPDLGYLM